MKRSRCQIAVETWRVNQQMKEKHETTCRVNLIECLLQVIYKLQIENNIRKKRNINQMAKERSKKKNTLNEPQMYSIEIG